MRKAYALMLWALLVQIGWAQAESPRLNAVWQTAYNRMTRQNDAWFKNGDYPTIVESLRYMNQVWPDDYETATNLGWMLGNIERPSEELATYVTFRTLNPGDLDGALPEADFYFRARAFAKIPPLLERVVGKKAHPNVYRLLAHSYERMNLLSDSKRVWDVYLGLMPTDGAAIANRNRVMKKISGQIATKKSP